ncbi:nuclear matrix protein [Lojkania enalia]|uniref:Nuclear matrix protein n=1 Tax=Lojkania enalia TaxID=147567 RepID=A0A9P4KH55_9PLEO|nr:nuclear matrix protein [Didymosphaeria enalia]
MAVPDVSPANSMAMRLNSLLNRANIIKQSSSIDPPLQVSKLATDDGPLFVRTLDDKDMHSTAFETASRNVFYRILAQTPITHPSFVSIWNLLDILQYCGDRDLCSPQLVLLLVEELLDSQSIDGCRIVFSFLESRREAIIANTSKNKDLVILRMCNELLRRLSRAEDSVFCGRVYIFLFQSFPLGDKSSVNLRGNFHVENVTTFEDYLKLSVPEENDMKIDTDRATEDVEDPLNIEDSDAKLMGSEKSAKEKSKTLDIDALYPVFWSLQHSFSNPPRLFEQENFKHFQKGLEATLAKFKEVPKVIQSGDSERKKAANPELDDNHDEFANTFNPKYLTSRDLFKLELSDLAFQRHILVQALILIDFLLTLTERSKKKPYYLNAQKAMQYAFTLREEDVSPCLPSLPRRLWPPRCATVITILSADRKAQTEWALGIKNSIANYLQEGPDGKFYYRMVDTVLSRDKNWVRWKMENCQPFTRDRIPTKHFLDAKSGAQIELSRKAVTKPSGKTLGLGYLSNTDAEKGLEALKRADRFTLPSAELYQQKNQTIELDLEMVTSEEERRQLEGGKTSNTWRGLRLASKDRLSSFDRVEYGKGLERLFQPVSSIEAASEDNAATASEGRDSVPQEQHQSVEEQRADQQSQVTADTTAEE